MKESPKTSSRFSDGILSAVSAVFFFILVGSLFITTPALFERITSFFSSFGIAQVPNTPIFLPAPTSPNVHSLVYLAVTQFSLVWGLFQAFILALRFIFGSSLDKKAETASNIVFWLGASYLVSVFLNDTTSITIWFEFWALLIMLIGLSMIARAIILMFRIRH